MNLTLIKKDGNKESIKLPSNILSKKYNEKSVHQFLTSYIYNKHKHQKKQKTRSEVRGGGKKPWQQKGSGRARAGSIRSPLWRGGGKVFASKYSIVKKKINKKSYKNTLKIIFSELFRKDRINIIENIFLNTFKTKNFLDKIKHLDISKYPLFIISNFNYNISLASRNLKNVRVVSFKELTPIYLIKHKKIFITKDTLENIIRLFK